MSYFDSSTQSTVYKQELNYTYDNFLLYNRDVKTLETGESKLKYIEFPYVYDPLRTNLFFARLGNKAWKTKRAFITGLLHNNITGLTDEPTSIVGELVIEHSPITNDTGIKLYTCFLIGPNADESATLVDNDIDNIVNWPKSGTQSLDSINIAFSDIPEPHITNAGSPGIKQKQTTIPKQYNYIYYEDTTTKNIVIIYLTPILVKSSNANKINNFVSEPPHGIFRINPPDQYTKGENPINPDNDDIYIDCNPTGVSEEEIKTYSLPIFSEMTGAKGQLDFMKTTVNFFVFVILIGLVYFTMPMLYKSIVIDIVKKDAAVDKNGQCTRIKSIDYFISLLFLLTIITCFFKGFSSDQTELLTTGLFLFVIYILSFVLIQSKKINDWKDCTSKDEGEGEAKFDFTDLSLFLGLGINYLIRQVSQFYLAIMLVLILLVSIPMWTGSIESNTVTYVLTICSIVMLPIATIMKLLIDKNES